MTARFDAILFDVGGVLVVPDPVAIAAALSPHGGSRSVHDAIMGHFYGTAALEALADELGLDSVESVDRSVYHDAVAGASGVVHTGNAARSLIAIWSPQLWSFPLFESVAAMSLLARRGVPMGIVSNADGQVEAMLRNRGVCQVGPGSGVPVRVVIDSHVVGVSKPNPAIFHAALPAFPGIDVSRIAYVGDTYHNDVLGAAAAGLTPLLYDPFRNREHRNCERLHSLHELLAWV